MKNTNRKCKLILKMPIEEFEDQVKGIKNNAKRLILSEPASSLFQWLQNTLTDLVLDVYRCNGYNGAMVISFADKDTEKVYY